MNEQTNLCPKTPMNSKQFGIEAANVDRANMEDVIARIDDNEARLLHHSIGISGESGELLDAIKKHIFYGAPLDVENIIEECGDILWYMTRLLAAVDYTLEDAMGYNNDKLNNKRYAHGYSDKAAHDRVDKVDEAAEALDKVIHRKSVCKTLMPAQTISNPNSVTGH